LIIKTKSPLLQSLMIKHWLC